MARPRKKWEPVYRFGGNPADYIVPVPLGESRGLLKVPKPKPKKTRKR